MEQLLHYVWKHKIFPLAPLQTVEGMPIEVIDTGLPNIHAGPDFFNAKIRIGGTLWVGNVEIHVRSSDWLRHGHNLDPAYDSVILHVASDIDYAPCRTNGEPIPQMELHYPDYLHKNYDELMRTEHYPPCYKLINKLPKILIHSWLSALQTERFTMKTKQIEELYEICDKDWERVFFITLARSFGFGVNSDAFERWAKSVPLAAVGKHRDSLFQVEAIFFGRAGLTNVKTADNYSKQLEKEYTYLSYKFSMEPHPDCGWRFLRLRPGNFPHVRIAQLASLYARSAGLLSVILEAESLEQLREVFSVATSVYWTSHYSFGCTSDPRPKRLSRQSVDVLIINAVIPMLYAYGRHKCDDKLCRRAESFLEKLKPENNVITRMWKDCGLEAEHAGDSQALIQLKKNYCDTRKCLFCRIGYEYFKKT